MLMDVRRSKSGSALVVTDPGGDVHACTTGEELWGALNGLLDDPEMPKAETVPPPRSSSPSLDEAEAAADALLGEFGARAVTGLLNGLRNVSHRNAPKRKSPEREAGGSG